jgi:hypothetical protein
MNIGWVPAAYLCDDAQKLAAILDRRFLYRFSPAGSGGILWELGVRRWAGDRRRAALVGLFHEPQWQGPSLEDQLSGRDL